MLQFILDNKLIFYANRDMYTMSEKKQDTLLVPITLSNVNQPIYKILSQSDSAVNV